MPELPEVETSRLGILPHIEGKCFKQVVIRQSQLRWPVPNALTTLLPGLQLQSVTRRGKYLLFATSAGSVLLHLGMSGNLRITRSDQIAGKHDHVDFIFSDDTLLRFNDQRKFGAVLWTSEAVENHPLLLKLGPEPLSDAFTADYLQGKAANRRVAVKAWLMDSHIVVGVGNIYANESLFLAGIHPARSAATLSQIECVHLVEAVKSVLQQAIQQGGTTLRDFTNAQGKPGYFQQSLNVYARDGEACKLCGQTLQLLKIGQRSSFFCSNCQK